MQIYKVTMHKQFYLKRVLLNFLFIANKVKKLSTKVWKTVWITLWISHLIIHIQRTHLIKIGKKPKLWKLFPRFFHTFYP